MPMSAQPLIAHRAPDAPVAWRLGAPVTARRFIAEARHVAATLPAGRHVLNLCGDRYHFAVALAASLLSGRVSLLPSTHTPETVRQMQRLNPDVFCIDDRDDAAGAPAVALPTYRYPASIPAGDDAFRIPDIACDTVVAQVFTSGSTGLPVPHVKRWGSLVDNARAEAARLGIDARWSILGTVPAQHMYGLESTVLLAWHSGAALHAGRPFFAADICAALADLPRPRMLVSTPFHLRTLLAEQASVPRADQVLSATAPLSPALALEAEARFEAPLHEIYGCTEAGQIASRRTAVETEWQTLPNVTLDGDARAPHVQGGHIEVATPLGDVVEPVGDGPAWTRFLLHGRQGDLINIAGKRTSLAYLNHQLTAIPGVHDGVFLERESGADETVARLTALVVAPTLTPAALMAALRERVDPIFLPRPLLFVDALPRTATGKLPRAITEALLASMRMRTDEGLVS